ncbi:MAG: hypothetical protein ACLTZT_01080 [Butyricimonas faecalis]
MNILKVAFVMNEVTEELIVAKEIGDPVEIKNKQRLYDRWKERVRGDPTEIHVFLYSIVVY